MINCTQGEGASTLDAAEAGILDAYLVKYWAIKYASNAAMTVLKVDQVSLETQIKSRMHYSRMHLGHIFRF